MKCEDCKDEKCSCPPVNGKAKARGLMGMAIPLQTLMVLLPAFAVGVLWWANVRDIPQETRALRTEIAEVKLTATANREAVKLQAKDFEHIAETLDEIKLTLRDMQRDRRVRYRASRPTERGR